MNRRSFVTSTSVALLGAGRLRLSAAPPLPDPPIGMVAATLSPFMDHRRRGGLALAELPKVVRGETGLRILDMNSLNFPSFEPALLERFRTVADREDCLLTNLKLNQPGLDLSSPDRDRRERTMNVYKKSVDAAGLMGMRWVRPLPTAKVTRRHWLVDGLRELADYAGQRNIGVLIENYGWMQSDADAVPDLIHEVRRDLQASPDTGNWANNDVRYTGLARAFPLAATCDFKVKWIGKDNRHPAYDLERCFELGRAAGFQGPWCIEHGHREMKQLLAEHVRIKGLLAQWLRNT